MSDSCGQMAGVGVQKKCTLTRVGRQRQRYFCLPGAVGIGRAHPWNCKGAAERPGGEKFIHPYGVAVTSNFSSGQTQRAMHATRWRMGAVFANNKQSLKR